MRLRTVEKYLVTGGLSLFALGACGDSDEHVGGDAGLDGGHLQEDAGNDAGPARDSGLSTVKCGTNTCTGAPLITLDIHPCCVLGDDGEETSVCGLNGEEIKRVNPSSPFDGCIPKDVPYASLSSYCGSFFDQVEPIGDHENGGLDVESPLGVFVFEGCCLPSGMCGANITSPRGVTPDAIDSHLGCVSYTRLEEAFGGQGAGLTPPFLPFCVPETGEPPASGTVPGAPEFVCGCGVGVVDDHAGMPCLNNLPEAVCGEDPASDELLAKVPEFICGCSEGSQLPCLKNLSASTCGTKPAAESEEELAKLPAFVCGGSSPFPSLPNVDSAVCGTAEVLAGSEFLAEVPALVCGCEGAGDASGYPCLRNVAHDVCGLSLASIPEFVAGCGEDVALGPTERLCIPFRAPSVHGEQPTEVDDARGCLTGVPEYAVGCGSETPSPTSACIPGVPAYFGCDEVSASAIVRGVPDYVCGCGDGLPYVAATRAFPCLSNVPQELCGAVVSQDPVADLPEYVCGCGEGAYYAGVGAPCLADRAASVCGAVDTALGSRDFGGSSAPCLVGVPEYARGCGDGAGGLPADASDVCLPHAGAPITDPQNPPERVFGCDEVTQPPPNLPEYLCGCGDDSPYTGGLPCLSFVAPSVCGMVAVTSAPTLAALLPSTPRTYCGCGDARLNDDPSSLDCLQNVPRELCGPGAAAISLGADGPDDDCVLGFPEGALGCGADATAGAYPVDCIPNVADTLPGCPAI